MYIGPIAVQVALDAIQVYIDRIAKEFGYNPGYIWGLAYGKSDVMIESFDGLIIKKKDGAPVVATDPLKKRLLYLFQDPRVLYRLLGKTETGETDSMVAPDPQYIPMQAANADADQLGHILGVPDLDVAPFPWADVVQEDVKRIVVTTEAVRLSIPMTDEERSSRVLANDADRFGYTFHTKFSKASWYGIDPNKDKRTVRIKGVFQEAIYPTEKELVNVPVVSMKEEITNHLATYDDGRAPDVSVTRDGDLLAQFHSQKGVERATNLKGPYINVSTLVARDDTSSSRPSSSYSSRGGSSSYSSRGGGSTSSRGGRYQGTNRR